MKRKTSLIAFLASATLHALMLFLAGRVDVKTSEPMRDQATEMVMVAVKVVQPPSTTSPPSPPQPRPSRPAPAMPAAPSEIAAPQVGQRPLASMDAPPPPTDAEWAFAASYTLKNSKGYRHSWGQQVRSLMGTVVEGPDQGQVRFRVEIAPDGSLSQLDTLWTTSPAAERLARQAIKNLPRLPPTPTGQPLVFEKTISFSPFITDSPPIYKDDCLPDPPTFRNPFAWNGEGAPRSDEPPAQAEPPDPQSLAECLRQLPQDSIEAEAAHDMRQLEQWRSMKLGR